MVGVTEPRKPPKARVRYPGEGVRDTSHLVPEGLLEGEEKFMSRSQEVTTVIRDVLARLRGRREWWPEEGE